MGNSKSNFTEQANGGPPPGVVLRRARRRRNWSQRRLIYELQVVAARERKSLATAKSLKAQISRWERGHRVPDEYNRRLLCEALGIPVTDLGLGKDHDAEG